MQQQRRRNGIILGLLALGLLAGVALTAARRRRWTRSAPTMRSRRGTGRWGS